MLVAFASAGATDVLYTTLGPNGEYDTASGYFVDGSNYFNQVLAMPFTPSQSENLSDAVLALGNYAGSNSPVNLYLESDNGGVPGSVSGYADPAGNDSTFQLRRRTGSVQLCGLRTGKRRYPVLDRGPGRRSQHRAGLDVCLPGPAGQCCFQSVGQHNGPWNQFNSTISGFRVDGAVPEPGTLVMLGSGIVAAAAGLRRKFNV